MDELISRKIKNWAAHQQAPDNSRARLMSSAALQAELMEAPELGSLPARVGIFWEILDFFVASTSDEAVRPFSAAGMWSIHMTVASLRFML